MMKRLILLSLITLISINIAFADPAIDSFKGKSILGGIVELSWTVSDAADSLDYLELYRGSEFIKQFDLTGGKFSDIYNDRSATPGDTYDYKIIVYNTNGNKVESQIQVVVDATPPKLTSPKQIITNQKTITIETDENTICIGGFKGSNLTLLEGSEKSHPLSAEFVDGQNIVSVVCSDESSNEFAAPEDLTVIYDTAKPSKPSLNVNVEGSTAKLSWDAASDQNGINKYNVYRSSGDGVFDEIASVTESHYEEAAQSGSVQYVVGAMDNAGNEERSDVKGIGSGNAKSSAPPIQAAAVADVTNQAAQSPGKKKSFGTVLWALFIAAAGICIFTYYRKKQDRLGLNSYLNRRSKMR